MGDLEKINPRPQLDKYIRLQALRLASAEDLNHEVDGELLPHVGKTIWIDFGHGTFKQFYRVQITGHRYQMTWLRPLLGRKIYVQVTAGEVVVVNRKTTTE